MNGLELAELILVLVTIGFGIGVSAMAYGGFIERRTNIRINDLRAQYAVRIADAERRAEEVETRMQARFDMLLELIKAGGNAANMAQARSSDFPLLEVLMNRFNLDEVNALAYEIGLPPEQIGGDTVPARSMNLIASARNRGWMPQLLSAIKRARPEVSV